MNSRQATGWGRSSQLPENTIRKKIAKSMVGNSIGERPSRRAARSPSDPASAHGT